MTEVTIERIARNYNRVTRGEYSYILDDTHAERVARENGLEWAA